MIRRKMKLGEAKVRINKVKFIRASVDISVLYSPWLVIAFCPAFWVLINCNYNRLSDRLINCWLTFTNTTFHTALSTFLNEILLVPVTFLVQHHVGENNQISSIGVKFVLHRSFHVSIHEKHRFMKLSFRAPFILSQKVDITIECSCSKFVRFCSK